MQACGSLQKTTFGQEREHKHITGQKQKARDARVQVEQKRKEKRPLSLCVMQCFAAYQEDCELLLTSSPLVGRQRLEKGGKTSCTQRPRRILQPHTYLTGNHLQRNIQELKAGIYSSCVECEHTVVGKKRSWNVMAP